MEQEQVEARKSLFLFLVKMAFWAAAAAPPLPPPLHLVLPQAASRAGWLFHFLLLVYERGAETSLRQRPGFACTLLAGWPQQRRFYEQSDFPAKKSCKCQISALEVLNHVH